MNREFLIRKKLDFLLTSKGIDGAKMADESARISRCLSTICGTKPENAFSLPSTPRIFQHPYSTIKVQWTSILTDRQRQLFLQIIRSKKLYWCRNFYMKFSYKWYRELSRKFDFSKFQGLYLIRFIP